MAFIDNYKCRIKRQEKLYCLDYLTRTLNQAGIFDKK